MALTMAELARLAGVCPATVSRVLNGTGPVSHKTRVRVLDAVERFHYHPNELARGLVNGRSRSVGVIVSQLENPFYAAVLSGIQQALGETGYSWLLGTSFHDAGIERAHLQDLRRRRVDGCILNPTVTAEGRAPNADLIDALRGDGVRVVVLQDHLGELGTPSVAYDLFDGICQAIDHLVALGHRRIGFISSVWWVPPDQGATFNARVRGYILGLNRNGLVLDPALTVYAPETFAGGAEGAARLLDRELPPTALLTHNDTVAVGALHALRQLGKRVPEEISVIGFDDTEVCAYLPVPLTSVALPKRELGRAAAAMLLAAMDPTPERAEPPERISLPTELIVRASTARAPRTGAGAS